MAPFDRNRFRSAAHFAKFESLATRNIIEERSWTLTTEELPEVQTVLQEQKLTYLNERIKPVSRVLIQEFYANAYRTDSEGEPVLESRVRGKRINFSADKINRILKSKPLEEHCPFQEMKMSMRRFWPFDEMKNLLLQEGKDWNPTTRATPSKMMVVDLAPIPKAWAFFVHHTLSTNQSGSDLIAERAMLLYFFLTHRPVNIGRIISSDIDDIAQSSSKKALGHASVIYLLCRKAGVPDLDGPVVRPAKSLGSSWLSLVAPHSTQTEELRDDGSRPSGTTRPENTTSAPESTTAPNTSASVPSSFAADMMDENSRLYRFMMSGWCMWQDQCLQMGIPARYMCHQTDLWNDAQRFRDRYSGTSDDPSFGIVRIPGFPAPFQMGGPFIPQQQQHQQTPNPQPTVSPLDAFVQGTPFDIDEHISFDADMQDRDGRTDA